MKKRLSLFVDGTDNIGDNNTSVWRLHSLVDEQPDEQGVITLRYYTKGVGTTFGSELRGGVGGYGTDTIIKDAYQWMIENFTRDDDIFIFGFSRGAYAARGLAGLVAKCGVLRRGSPIGVGELFERYKTVNARTIFELDDAKAADALGQTTILEQWMLDYSARAAVTMVGVWDTVGALVFEKGTISTGLREPIKSAFHALAIDEHRERFAPTLYTINNRLNASAGTPKRYRPLEQVEQRWFAGAHANVGGGYDSDLLPRPALNWLMAKAHELGMQFREPIPDASGLYDAAINDSFKEFLHGAYRAIKLGRPYYRPIGVSPWIAGQDETSNVNETIDSTVFERWRRVPAYRPQNLIDWAKRMGVDPASRTTTVWALKPNESVVGPL